MKQLTVYFLLLAAVLLLIPLPLLAEPAAQPTADPVTTTPGTTSTAARETAATAATTVAAAAKADETDVFRVMLSGTVKTFAARDFLRTVVVCEMPLTYGSEALKAQAVASYTYFSYRRQQARQAGKTADFDDVPSAFAACCTEAGLRKKLGEHYAAYRKKLDAAIEAVYGQTLRYNGELILSVYHAVSTGQTASGQQVWQTDYPYLQAVPSPGDTASPDYTATKAMTAAQVKRALGGIKGVTVSGKPAAWLTHLRKTEDGLVTDARVCGATVTGTALRKALGLRSGAFTVRVTDTGFVFTVRGYGHNVGMSQYGAGVMAEQGADYREILHHYYTGVTVKKT